MIQYYSVIQANLELMKISHLLLSTRISGLSHCAQHRNSVLACVTSLAPEMLRTFRQWGRTLIPLTRQQSSLGICWATRYKDAWQYKTAQAPFLSYNDESKKFPKMAGMNELVESFWLYSDPTIEDTDETMTTQGSGFHCQEEGGINFKPGSFWPQSAAQTTVKGKVMK